jgi:nucleotide-binding universal stress UspA family protein
MGYASMMVHLDVERDSEQRVQLALDLATRFDAALIGVAGLALRPVFKAGGLVVYTEPTKEDLHKLTARFEAMGKKFLTQGQGLKHVEWRAAAEAPLEVVAREARAADLLIVGARHPAGTGADLFDPGVILLRAGRPILVVPEIAPPLPLRRVVIAWKDTRECRRAVRDALPFLQQAKEVLVVGIGEAGTEADGKKVLADVASYLVRHRVAVADDIWRRARGPAVAELLHLVREEGADLIVAGGYGHSRLREMFFSGVTRHVVSHADMPLFLVH